MSGAETVTISAPDFESPIVIEAGIIYNKEEMHDT